GAGGGGGGKGFATGDRAGSAPPASDSSAPRNETRSACSSYASFFPLEGASLWSFARSVGGPRTYRLTPAAPGSDRRSPGVQNSVARSRSQFMAAVVEPEPACAAA